jgi:leader peptidase (prepilin peptidase)/N-methyltransferase
MYLIIILATAGFFLGLLGHQLLSRLRRGATVHKGWCAGGVAILWSIAAWRVADGHLSWWWLPIPLVAAWFAVLLTVVDLKHRRLPNALTLAAYPATAATIAMATTQAGWQLAAGALMGATALAALYLTIHKLAPQAMGGGDVKLSGSQGAILGAVGWPAVLVGTTLAALLTLALRAVAPKHTTTNWRTGIPHGPGLLTATYLIATFAGIRPP